MGRIERDLEMPNWIDFNLSGKMEVAWDDAWSWYLVSLHWSTMTVTSIGYGDISPHTRAEFGVSIFCQFLGAVAWAACVSQLAGIFANLSPHETAWKQDMDAMANARVAISSDAHVPVCVRRCPPLWSPL